MAWSEAGTPRDRAAAVGSRDHWGDPSFGHQGPKPPIALRNARNRIAPTSTPRPETEPRRNQSTSTTLRAWPEISSRGLLLTFLRKAGSAADEIGDERIVADSDGGWPVRVGGRACWVTWRVCHLVVFLADGRSIRVAVPVWATSTDSGQFRKRVPERLLPSRDPTRRSQPGRRPAHRG